MREKDLRVRLSALKRSRGDRCTVNRVSNTASPLVPGLRRWHQVLLCVGFYALIGCSSREFVERTYVSIDDVTRQNAFSPAGKVPVRLPPSSVEIRIRSSVQTDDVWAVFSWDDTTRGRLNELIVCSRTSPASQARVG